MTTDQQAINALSKIGIMLVNMVDNRDAQIANLNKQCELQDEVIKKQQLIIENQDALIKSASEKLNIK